MKNKIKIALSLLVLLSLGGVAQAQDNSLQTLRERGVIRIANTQTSPPWSQLGSDNQPAGYDVAVAQELAKRLGIAKVEFVADNYKNFVEGLKTGKYDLVMNDLTPTPERLKQVDFAAPYAVEEFYLFVRDHRADITDIKDMPGHSVAVTAGSSNEYWARQHMTSSDIRAYENGGLVYQDLAIGRVDAVLASLFSGENNRTTNNLPIKAIGQPLTYMLSAPAMAKGQDALREAVSKAVDDMTADGTITRLSSQWVGPDYKMLEGINAAKAEAVAQSAKGKQ